MYSTILLIVIGFMSGLAQASIGAPQTSTILPLLGILNVIPNVNTRFMNFYNVPIFVFW